MIIDYFMGYKIYNALTPNCWFCPELNLTNFKGQAQLEIAIQNIIKAKGEK